MIYEIEAKRNAIIIEYVDKPEGGQKLVYSIECKDDSMKDRLESHARELVAGSIFPI